MPEDIGLTGIDYKDDKFIYTHCQDVDGVRREVYNERNGNDSNGYTDGRTMRKVGSIPFIEFLTNPVLNEAMKSGDQELLSKAVDMYLRTEGKQYCTVTKGL